MLNGLRDRLRRLRYRLLPPPPSEEVRKHLHSRKRARFVLRTKKAPSGRSFCSFRMDDGSLCMEPAYIIKESRKYGKGQPHVPKIQMLTACREHLGT